MLADQLTGSNTGGPDELRRRLNGVLAPAVAALIARGGDVMGFAGQHPRLFPFSSRDVARSATELLSIPVGARDYSRARAYRPDR